jgi:hypothetical protein
VKKKSLVMLRAFCGCGFLFQYRNAPSPGVIWPGDGLKYPLFPRDFYELDMVKGLLYGRMYDQILDAA